MFLCQKRRAEISSLDIVEYNMWYDVFKEETSSIKNRLDMFLSACRLSD